MAKQVVYGDHEEKYAVPNNSKRKSSDYESEDDAPLSKHRSASYNYDEKAIDVNMPTKIPQNQNDINDENFTSPLFDGSTQCIPGTVTKHDLEKSKVKVNGKTHYHCPVCNQNLRSALSFVTHQRIHSRRKNFTCEICRRKFKVVRFLISHLKYQHSMKDDEDYNEFQELHSKKNKNVTQLTVEGSPLNFKAPQDAKIVVDNRTYYECPICAKKLTRVTYYIAHMSIHTGEKKYVCHECGKSFRFMATLERHIRLTHKGIKKYSCEVCHKKFGTNINLIEHVRIHTGEKPHVCAKCGERFKHKSCLYSHNRSHTDHFPFQCSQCNAKFRIQSRLNYHMRKHTGEKPYTCDVCNKSFAISTLLNRHKIIHTDEKPFSCSICEKAFRHKRNLQTHEKNCHNKPK